MQVDIPVAAPAAFDTVPPSPPSSHGNSSTHTVTNETAGKMTTPSQRDSQPSTPQPASQPSPPPTQSEPAASQVSASLATPSTAETIDTDMESPVVAAAAATEDRDVAILAGPTGSASASASASASVSACASAADEAEHNDSTSSSSGASVGPASQASNGAPSDVRVAGADDSPDDMDRFLRRVEMEKKIAQLQQRLELASIKTNHGWTDMSIKEIETRLPQQLPPRAPPIIIPNGRGPSYEPPSPSRPWQLADVLWQPLPPVGGQRGYPSRPSPHTSNHAQTHSLPGGLPSIGSLGTPRRGGPPSSPNRHRVGMDEYLTTRPTPSPLSGYPNGHHPHRSPAGGGGSGHRRAASSMSSLQFLSTDPYPPPGNTPGRQKKALKKRSQSQSNLRDRPTTQDVDAARALTFMLESGRSPVAPGPPEQRRYDNGPHSASAISPGSGWPSHGHPSQHFPPPPQSAGPPMSPFSDMPPPRPRAQSFMVPGDPHDNYARPQHLLPPPHPHPMVPGFPKSHHLGHGRGTSMDSSTFGRSFWRSSPEKDRARERERERERERNLDRERREHERMQEDEMMGRGEDDKAAAELMMFLAHSPSPIRPKRNSADAPSLSGTARVLFSDMPPRGGDRSAGTMGPPLSVRR